MNFPQEESGANRKLPYSMTILPGIYFRGMVNSQKKTNKNFFCTKILFIKIYFIKNFYHPSTCVATKMANSILRYYQRKTDTGRLPAPLTSVIPPDANAANREVQAILDESRKRGLYGKYTPKERAEVGRFAVENGILATVRKYTRVFGRPINESTVHTFKKAYLEEQPRKRRAGNHDDCTVDELPLKKRGRPLLVGSKMDLLYRNTL